MTAAADSPRELLNAFVLAGSQETAMTRLSRGSGEALQELYDRYAGLVTSIALSILHDPTDAEDVVQAVFVQAWSQAHRYDVGRGSAEAWFSTLARTRSLDFLRKRKTQRGVAYSTFRGPVTLPSVLQDLQVQQALEGLPAHLRQTLELAYYEGPTQTEVAERLGAPLGTIKTHTRTALRELRKTLGARDTSESGSRSSRSKPAG